MNKEASDFFLKVHSVRDNYTLLHAVRWHEVSGNSLGFPRKLPTSLHCCWFMSREVLSEQKSICDLNGPWDSTLTRESAEGKVSAVEATESRTELKQRGQDSTRSDSRPLTAVLPLLTPSQELCSVQTLKNLYFKREKHKSPCHQGLPALF